LFIAGSLLSAQAHFTIQPQQHLQSCVPAKTGMLRGVPAKTGMLRGVPAKTGMLRGVRCDGGCSGCAV